MVSRGKKQGNYYSLQYYPIEGVGGGLSFVTIIFQAIQKKIKKFSKNSENNVFSNLMGSIFADIGSATVNLATFC